jgi:glucan phosphoethanolaminetransferase (alkaline phosphatase superfamily)
MSTAKTIALVAFAMIMVPGAGIFFYLMIGGMIDSYKHAKFLDKVHGTNQHVRNEIITILMVAWAFTAGVLLLVASLISELSPRT